MYGVAITSISPTHVNGEVQFMATKSWEDLGYLPVSLNHPSEIEILKDKYPHVKFIPTLRTMEMLYGKKYVAINAMMDWAKEQDFESVLIINSDIILEFSLAYNKLSVFRLTLCNEGLVVIKREDFNNDDRSDAKRYDYGMDAFLIHKKFLNIFPQSVYCMGQTWWDFWVPYTALKNKLPIYLVREPMAFHKAHNTQYTAKEWVRMTNYFQWEQNMKLGERADMTTGRIYHEIHNAFNNNSVQKSSNDNGHLSQNLPRRRRVA